MIIKTLHSASPDDTAALARRIGAAAPAGAVIAASGPLGAGKTLFAANFARGLGLRETVTSPTYIYFRLYPGPRPFCHLDAYRLQGLSEEEIALIGVEDCFARGQTVFAEWAEYIEDWLPPGSIRLAIDYGPLPDARLLTFTYAESEDWLHAIIGD